MKLFESQLEKLRGQTAWIIGGKRIGQVVARALAEAGVNIVAGYLRSREEAQSLVDEALKLGVQALAVQTDASVKDSVAKALEAIRKKFSQIDILLNMASIFKPKAVEEITEADWQQNFGVHVLGAFWPVQLLLPVLPRGAHVINIVDRTAIGKIYPGYLPYVVSKASLAQLTRALAVELAPRGIFVNAIAPGPILRPADISEADWQKNRESSPLKFAISDEEAVAQFASLVLYLCVNDMASGHVYPLDQGLNL